MLVKVAGVLTHRDSVHMSFTWRRLRSYSRLGSLSMLSLLVSSSYTCDEGVSVTPVVRVSWATLVSCYELLYFSGPLCLSVVFGLTKVTNPTSLGLA